MLKINFLSKTQAGPDFDAVIINFGDKVLKIKPEYSHGTISLLFDGPKEFKINHLKRIKNHTDKNYKKKGDGHET